ncbi:hypothetical protein [Agrococcus sp. ARC_14]|uniref:hypothetical protein n=1 Tax=Agrococcus sp. ARC_14 TaxID=2919927 RepID=UPI001F05C40C|nr:hypothetical protein [Agrococcus sp. ARC_14]MCH1884141.1 hypothetical protein [Agrococcus sp. ARC_14]
MSDIRITYETLDGAVTNLGFVATQLSASDDTSEAAAGAVGHDGLAGRVREFADSWDDNRERFQEAAEDLADAVAGITMAFRELDVRLAADR